MPRSLSHTRVSNLPGDARSEAARLVWWRGFRELCTHVAAGRIDAPVDPYPLGRVAEAWERQASGSPRAKIVLTL